MARAGDVCAVSDHACIPLLCVHRFVFCDRSQFWVRCQLVSVAGRDGVDGLRGLSGIQGKTGTEGAEGNSGDVGSPGRDGATGDVGPIPAHKWRDTSLTWQIGEEPDGSVLWGKPRDLQGRPGADGKGSSASGGAILPKILKDIANGTISVGTSDQSLAYFLGE